jgi:hypothetical protein
VVDGGAQRVVVEPAGDVGDRVRIRSGLSGGETVVVEGEPSRAGQRLRIADR